ncbi:MAG: hypothetical protein ACXAEU_15035 [Candidatus Hodarchaeales archaeon]
MAPIPSLCRAGSKTLAIFKKESLTVHHSYVIKGSGDTRITLPSTGLSAIDF